MWTGCLIQKQQAHSNVQRENRQNWKPQQCLHKEILVAGLEMLFTIHFFLVSTMTVNVFLLLVQTELLSYIVSDHLWHNLGLYGLKI